MAAPDNRIKFPPTKIDFSVDVGETGQAHDNYPAPSGQARYDWMRLFLIGLLSCQSSTEEPIQYREGTPWFDLNTSIFKIRSGDAWVSLADVIPLTVPNSDGQVVTLASWYIAVQNLLVGLAPEIVFHGSCDANDITTINVPTQLQEFLTTESRIFLYINGALVSPLSCSLIGSPVLTTIKLSGVSLSSGDSFIVNIRRIAAETFFGSNVVVP